MKQYDAIIIGFGKGGKLLAAELAERNWKVAIVERSPQMYGGTCVNVGCIPTKTLIHESEYAEKRYYDDYKNQSKLYALAVARKDKLVSFLREKNYENVKNKPNITLYDGTASFLSENTIRIVSGKDETILEGKEIFINTGSTPILPAIDGLKESKYVYTSETLLQSNKLPAHLLVIGGGAVGLEFATMYAGFGSHVTLLEAGNRFLPKVDRDIAASMLEALNRKRINVRLNARVQSVYDTAEGITLTYTDSANGTPYYLKGDALLVAIGRKPMTAELNLEKAGIQTDKRGAIVVDNQLRTTAPHVWALGDVKGDEQFDYLSIDDFRIIRNQLFENKKRSTKDRYPIPFDSFCLFHAFVNISEAEIFLSYELVARIEIAPRCYRKVLGSGTAAGKTFINTWSAGQIDHEMEEIEASSFFFSLDHLSCQNVVLFENHRKVFLADRVILGRRCYNRLNRDLFEAEVCQMEDVGSKVCVVMREGSAHIVFVLMTEFSEFLEFRHDQIVASGTFAERTHVIVNFFSSVDT